MLMSVSAQFILINFSLASLLAVVQNKLCSVPCVCVCVTSPCHHVSSYTSFFLTTFSLTDQIMSKVSYWLEAEEQLWVLADCVGKRFAIFG